MTAHQARTIWQDFTTRHRFPIVFGRKLLFPGNPILRDVLCIKEPNKCHKVTAVVDAGLLQADPQLLDRIGEYVSANRIHINLTAEPIVLPGGEEVKDNDSHYWQLMEHVCLMGVDRHSYLLAIGGGSLLDLVGFVAATAHRGIRHVRMPTTVLGQCDSGVGVKNGINFGGCKNFVGTFSPPWAVLNDFDFFDVLPPRDKISGMAEAVKVSLIRDRHFFETLEQSADRLADFEPISIERLIQRSAELHMAQISGGGDPFETGNSRPLDFGHWAAHRLEVLSNYEVRHGEAVAIGMALDSYYSVLSGRLAESECERITDLLLRLNFTLWHPLLLSRDKYGEYLILMGLQQFREHLGGKLTITLLSKIGSGVDVHEMEDAIVLRAINALRDRFEK